MSDSNTLKFSVTVDGSGLKDFESKSVSAFSGVKKAVDELGGYSKAQLSEMADSAKAAASQFKELAQSLGISPNALKQTLSYIREINAATKQSAADEARAASQAASADSARKRAAQDLYNLEMKSVRDLNAERNNLNKNILSSFSAQEAQLRKLDSLASGVLGGGGSKFGSAFSNVFSGGGGGNNGFFSNLAGGFGGGRGIGAIAAGLDGAAGGGASALLGGLAGGAAIAGILALGDAIKTVTGYVVDFTKASVSAAADFQQTTNAFIAFTGSASDAHDELAKVDEMARNTPGLAMVTAEKGVLQLRALGFQADTARGLIEGLSKQRILSGKDDEDVQRVVTHLAQLSTGAVRAGQDIRLIFRSLPTLKQQFLDAYGTLNSNQIANQFQANPEEALQKLSDQLAKTKGVQGGLNTATIDFWNEWTQIERNFGGPLLEPLTHFLQGLTKDLDANSGKFAEWGENLGRVLSGIPDWVSHLASLASGINRIGTAVATVGVSEFGPSASQSRNALNNAGLTTPGASYGLGLPDFHHPLANPLGMFGINQDQSASDIYATEQAKALTEQANKLQKLSAEYADKKALAEEAQQKEALDNLNANYKEQTDATDIYYRTLEAQRKSHFAKNKQEELAQITQSGSDEQAHFAARLADAQAHYATLEQLDAGNGKALAKDEKEKAAEIKKITGDMEVAKINAASAAAAKMREIAKEDRVEASKALDLQIADVKNYNDQFNRDIREGLDKGSISTTAGYAELRQVAQDSFDKILAADQAKNQIALSDDTLTEGTRINLKKQFGNEELKLRSDLANQLRDIDKQEYQQRVEDLKRNASEMQAVYKSESDIFSGLGAFFDPSKAVGKFNLPKLDTFVNAGYDAKRTQLKAAEDLAGVSAANLRNARDKGTLTPEMEQGYNDEATAVVNLSKAMQALSRVEFPGALKQLFQLGQDMASGKVGVDGFDIAAKKLLQIKQDFESADLESQIDLAKRLLELATGKDAKYANKKDADTLQHQLDSLSNQKVTLGIKQQAEALDEYNNSYAGLQEKLGKLRSGDVSETLGAVDNARKTVAKEGIDLQNQNIELEYRMANVGIDSADKYKNAWLSAIYDIQKASEDAKAAEIADQVAIADQTVFHADRAREQVLAGMKQAKGLTDIFSDGFLQITSSISDGIGGLLDKATAKLGAFGHAISSIATQLLSMITNRLMMKLLDLILPASGGASGGGGLMSGIGGSSSGGGILSSIGGLGKIFGGIFGGGSAASGGAGGGGILSSLGGLLTGGAAGGGLSSSLLSSDTLSGQLGGMHDFGALAGVLGSPERSGINDIGGQLSRGGGSLLGGGGSFLNILGAAAPMLGFSLGGMLGGPSTTGHVLGAAGGLLGGIALGGIFGTGSITTLASILGGTGVLAPLAGALVVGAILLGKKAQRDADEKTRTQYLGDASTQLTQILADTNSHKYSTGADALAAANQVIAQYTDQANSIKDGKTRRIALNELNKPNKLWYEMDQITTAAAKLDSDTSYFNSLGVPEFATGGIVPGTIGMPRLVLAHGGEIIANLSQQTPDLLAAANGAGIPGVRGSAGSGGSSGGGPIHVEFVMGTNAQNEIYVNGSKSQAGYNAGKSQAKKRSDFRETSF